MNPEDDRVVAFIEWLFDQGYEIVNRPMLEQKNARLSKQIHPYCLDQLEGFGLLDDFRAQNGEPPLDYGDSPLTTSA